MKASAGGKAFCLTLTCRSFHARFKASQQRAVKLSSRFCQVLASISTLPADQTSGNVPRLIRLRHAARWRTRSIRPVGLARTDRMAMIDDCAWPSNADANAILGGYSSPTLIGHPRTSSPAGTVTASVCCRRRGVQAISCTCKARPSLTICTALIASDG